MEKTDRVASSGAPPSGESAIPAEETARMARPGGGGAPPWLSPAAHATLLLLSLILIFCWYRYRAPAARDAWATLTFFMAGLAVLTFLRPVAGILALLAMIPLFNSLAFHIPAGHFAPSMLLFWPTAAGWAAGRLWRKEATSAAAPEPRLPVWIAAPLAGWALLGALSALAVMLRYAEFSPFTSRGFELITINRLGETNEQAIQTAFETAVIFLAGPAMAWAAAWLAARPRGTARGAIALTAGLALSALYGVWQARGHEGVANPHHFALRDQINATFLDPNALGLWYGMAIPVALGVAITSRRWLARGAVALILLAALATLGESGSRSGILAILVALGSLAAAWAWRRRLTVSRARRARAAWITALLAAGAAIALFAAFAGPLRQTALGRRLHTAREDIRENGLLGLVKKDRWELWSRALRTMGEFPASGVGLGAYWMEIPNILRIDPREGMYRDNAANWFLQAGAELGALGLALGIWVFGTVVFFAGRRILRFARDPGSPPSPALFAAAAVLGLIALFPTGPHLNAAETQLLFWFLAGTLFAEAPPLDAPRKTARWPWAAAGALALLAGALQWGASFGPLSIASRQRETGFECASGFYPPETDANGEPFRWMGREAWILLPASQEERIAALGFSVPHADAAERPVRLELFLDEQNVRTIEFTQPFQVLDARVHLPASREEKSLRLRMRVDRTLIPARDIPGSGDTRELGAMVKPLRLLPASAAQEAP